MALPGTHRQVVWIKTFYKLKSYSRPVSEGLRLSLWWWMFLCAPWEAVQLYYSHCFAARLTFLKMVLSSSQRLNSYLLGCVQWVTRCWSGWKNHQKLSQASWWGCSPQPCGGPGFSYHLVFTCTWFSPWFCSCFFGLFHVVHVLGVFCFFLSYQVTEKTYSFPSVTCNPYQHDSLQEQVQR